MKKNKKTVEAFIKQKNAKNAILAGLKKKLAENTLSEEAKAEAQRVIDERQAEIDAIQAAIDEMEAAEEDRSEELMAKIAELQERQRDIENALAEPKGVLAVSNFINSDKGMDAFVHAVKNSATREQFFENWKNELVKNDITPNTFVLPEAVLQEIGDTWETNAPAFLELLDITGLKAGAWGMESGDDEATSRAQGHKKGTEKNEQTLELTKKEVRAQIVYKYITIDRETADYEDNGVLMRYVARELTLRLMNEIVRAVLVGDGRATGADNKISKIEAVDRAATDAYVTVSTAAAQYPTIEEVATAIANIEHDGEIVVAMNKKTALNLRAFVAASGGTTQYRSLDELAAQIGADRIYLTKYVPATTGNAAVIAFIGRAYKVVGDLRIDGFEDFNLQYNKKEYLTETYVGGALVYPKSGAVVKSANS